MKRYEVIVTPEDEIGIVSAFDYINQHSPEKAAKWLRALYAEIDTLEMFPKRCSLAREDEYFEDALRQLIFKSHRLIFRIEETAKIVRILCVRHGKQRTLGEPDKATDD